MQHFSPRQTYLIILIFIITILLVGCNTANSTIQTNNSETQNEITESRTISHLAGETTIEGTPNKIAVLDYRLADSLLALGVTPYAMTTYLGETELPYMDGTLLADAIPLGDKVELETLLEAKPDLIIARKSDQALYDSLSKIAPTIILSVPDDWRKGFEEIASILEKEDGAKKWLTTYEEKVESVKDEITPFIESGDTFLYLRVMSKEIRVHGTDHNLSATLFHDLALTHVPGLENLGKVETISMEAIIKYDADHIFIENGGPNSVDDPEAQANYQTLTNSSIWKNMKAVQKDQVYRMPPWVISDYPNIKLKSLDLIQDYLTTE